MEKSLIPLIIDSSGTIRGLFVYAFLIALITPQLIALHSLLSEGRRPHRRLKRLHMLAETFQNLSSDANPEPARRLSALLQAEIDDIGSTILEPGQIGAKKEDLSPIGLWLFGLSVRIVLRLLVLLLALIFILLPNMLAYSQIHYWREGDLTGRDIFTDFAISIPLAVFLIWVVVRQTPRFWSDSRLLWQRVRPAQRRRMA